ncbi:hypothetical protein [Nocardioides terrisoli]|uniref:hypothetical protein n=1 Tax=Nocardioides terrisoli TaxID=3388267 RepID=UPI00287B841A|nr:hypothetical protein [Nocardioides marmorisolisilvae]
MTTMLPQPSLTADELHAALGGSHILTDGGPPGIIATHPMSLQCADCGAVETQPEGRSWPAFILTCGYGFHTCTRGAEGRLCRDCLAVVKGACDKAACRA